MNEDTILSFNMNLMTFATSQNQSRVIMFKLDWNQMLSQDLEIVEDYKQKEVFGKRILKRVGNVS